MRLAAWARPLLALGLALAALAYLWFVRENCSYFAGGSDSSGYANFARRLHDGGLVGTVAKIPGLRPPAWNYGFQEPLGFRVNGSSGTMAPTYPVGFPLHLLLATLIVGRDYSLMLVAVCAAAAAAALIAALARSLGLSWGWSLSACAILWACPLFVYMELQLMSDAVATVWVMAAVLFAALSRGRWQWSCASGFALGAAVLVRPTDLLALLPIMIACGGSRRAWAGIVLGGIPSLAFLAALNHILYGSALATGYSGVGALLGLRFAPDNAAHFATWIFLLLTPLIAGPALGILYPKKGRGLASVLLAAWIGAFIGFYVFYFTAGNIWWNLRLILPAFPAIILAGLLVVEGWHARIGSRRLRSWAATLGLLCVLCGELAVCRRLDVSGSKHTELNYFQAADWARSHLPDNAIMMVMQNSGCLTYYTSFTIVRWDLITAGSWADLQRAARSSQRPIYAALFGFEEGPALKGRIPGMWSKSEQIRAISIWRLAN